MRREWTDKEINYMNKFYLRQPICKTADKLNRTVASVKHKAVKMGLNHYTNNLNARTLARCFGVDVNVVVRWIEKFDLPCGKVECATQTRYVLDTEKFWKWAELHKDIINWNKYERKSLVPEPDWVSSAICNCNVQNVRKKYTEQDIVAIKGLLHRGLGYKEIAKQMGRSYYGINHLGRKIYK